MRRRWPLVGSRLAGAPGRAWPAPTLEGAPRARARAGPAKTWPGLAQWSTSVGPGAARGNISALEGQPSPRAVGQTLRIGVTIASGVHTADTAGADWRLEHAKSPHEHQRKHHRLTCTIASGPVVHTVPGRGPRVRVWECTRIRSCTEDECSSHAERRGTRSAAERIGCSQVVRRSPQRNHHSWRWHTAQ